MTTLGLQVVAIKPGRHLFNFEVEFCKEVLSKIRSTLKDSQLPKTYENKIPRNKNLVLKQKRCQIFHDQDYWKIMSSFSHNRHHPHTGRSSFNARSLEEIYPQGSCDISPSTTNECSLIVNL